MYVCSECGLGYLGVEICPRCHFEEGSGGAEVHIPWVRVHTRWTQVRIDGSTWILSVDGPEPLVTNLVDVKRRKCKNYEHFFVGTDDAQCSICRPEEPQTAVASEARPPNSFTRWIAPVFIIVGLVTIGALSLQDSTRPAGVSDASPVVSSTTVIEATPTTSTLPIAAPEFLDAVAYEASLLAVGRRVERTANRVLEITAQWDSRQMSLDLASAQLAQQQTEIMRVVTAVDGASVYGASELRHDAVSVAIRELADAVAAVREGLLEPGSRVARDAATHWTVAAADLLLESVDDALLVDQSRLRRAVGTPVLWVSLRVGDCVDMDDHGGNTEIVACSKPGRGEVLATPVLHSSRTASPFVCTKAAWGFVDVGRFEPDGGSWEIRDGTVRGSTMSHICVYVGAMSSAALVVRGTRHVGPFVSNQWDALETLGLVSARPFEVGECFVVPPEDEPELVSDRYRVDCDADHDFSLSAVVAVVPPSRAEAFDRFTLRSWDVCAETVPNSPSGEPYLVSDAIVFPMYPGFDEAESPMVTLVCVLRWE